MIRSRLTHTQIYTSLTDAIYSDFLIDFALHKEPDGSEWHGWSLKPEAEAALRQLKIVA